MALRGGTVRTYLQAIQRVAAIPGATEHTYRAALGAFLVAAAEELGFGHVTVRSELRLADVASTTRGSRSRSATRTSPG